MRRAFLLTAVLAGVTATASAQGIKLADVAGVWDGKTMVGPKDSVATTTVMTMTADGKGWTITFPGRKDAVPVRVVTSGGDSIVSEAGPYPSVLRPGQTVKLLRITGHFKGAEMWGTFVAEYGDGGKASGKISATRRK